MAKIRINDLDESVELDRKAMAEIIGGRSARQYYSLGIGTAAQAGATSSTPGPFRGKGAFFYKPK